MKKEREFLIEALEYYNSNREHAVVAFDVFVGRIKNKEAKLNWFACLSHKRKTKILTEEYQRWMKIAEFNGLDYDEFYKRVNINHMPYWQAATMKRKTREIPNEIIERALLNGISVKMLRQRIVSQGWDFERACTTPIRPKRPNGQGKIRRKTAYNVSPSSRKSEERLLNKSLRQVNFYVENKLPIPKKYIKILEKHNMVAS